MTQTTVPWNTSQDGQRITVNAMIKAPAVVRARMLDMAAQQFITDALLRPGPNADGGAIQYWESTPLYADDDAAIVKEFAEIPRTIGEFGIPHVTHTVKAALALIFSEEMRTRDDVGAVDLQMTQIRNTLRRYWDRVFMQAILNNASVHTEAATAAWSSGSSKIRYDLAQAMYLITNSDSDSTDNSGQNKFEYEPDTLVINNKTAADFLASDDVAKVFINSPLADQNLQYTGKMTNKFFGLDVLQSWQVPAGYAIVLQRKVIGGISDERPFTVGGLFQDQKTETWQMNVSRMSAVFIDQPKAACIISGV